MTGSTEPKTGWIRPVRIAVFVLVVPVVVVSVFVDGPLFGVPSETFLWTGTGFLFGSTQIDEANAPLYNAVLLVVVGVGGVLLGLGQGREEQAVAVAGLALFAGALLYDGIRGDDGD